jgi:hypothetical protein
MNMFGVLEYTVNSPEPPYLLEASSTAS